MKMNKRMLSLTLALVMILGSLSTVFGLEVDHVLDTEKKAGEFLYDNDVLIGGDGGNLFLDQNLTRRDSIVLLSRLLGEEDAAKNYKVGKYPTFTDVKKGSYYTPFAGWAQDNGYYKGGDDNKLYPMDHITARQYATVLLRALGYSEKEWNGVFEQAKDLGLFKYLEEVEEDTKITRGQMALMTVNALYQNLEGEEDKTLADKLEIDMPAIPEKPVEGLKVMDVELVNAKEILVTYNKEIGASAKEAENYEVTINGKKYSSNEAIKDIKVLGEDKNQALIRLKDIDNVVPFTTADKVTLQISSAILGKDNLYTSDVMEFTSVAPKLKNGFMADEGLVLEFDRPVKAMEGLTLVKIDGFAVKDEKNTGLELVRLDGKEIVKDKDNDKYADGDLAGNYTYLVSKSNDSKFKTVGEHEVSIFDVADAALKNAKVRAFQTGSYKIEKEVAVEEEETAPKVVSIKALNANKFEVVFDQELANNDFDIEVKKGNHTFPEGKDLDEAKKEGSTLVKTEAELIPEDVAGRSKAIVVITGLNEKKSDINPLYARGEEEVDLKVTVTNHKSVKEKLIGEPHSEDLTLSVKDGRPELLDGKFDKEGIVFPYKADEPKFTEDYDKSKGKYLVLKDAEGVVIGSKHYDVELNGKVDVDGDTIEVLKITAEGDNSPLNGYKSDYYTLEVAEGAFEYEANIDSIESYNLRNLKNDAHTVTAAKTGELAEEQDGFKYYVLDAEKVELDISKDGFAEIVIDYGVEMNGDTALDLDNYKLDGKKLPKGSKVDFLNNKKTVAIRLPEGTFQHTTDYRFEITTNVETALGQPVVRDAQTKLPVIKISEVKDNTRPELKSVAYAVKVEDEDQSIKDVKKTNLLKLTFSEPVKFVKEDAGKGDVVELEINKVTIKGKLVEYDEEQSFDENEDVETVLLLELEKEVGINQDGIVEVLEKDNLVDYSLVDEAKNPVKPGIVDLKAKDVAKIKMTKEEKDNLEAAKELEEAKKAVEALLNGEELAEGVDQEKINAAKELINALKDEDKEDLQATIDKAQELLELEEAKADYEAAIPEGMDRAHADAITKITDDSDKAAYEAAKTKIEKIVVSEIEEDTKVEEVTDGFVAYEIKDAKDNTVYTVTVYNTDGEQVGESGKTAKSEKIGGVGITEKHALLNLAEEFEGYLLAVDEQKNTIYAPISLGGDA